MLDQSDVRRRAFFDASDAATFGGAAATGSKVSSGSTVATLTSTAAVARAGDGCSAAFARIATWSAAAAFASRTFAW